MSPEARSLTRELLQWRQTLSTNARPGASYAGSHMRNSLRKNRKGITQEPCSCWLPAVDKLRTLPELDAETVAVLSL